MATVIVTGANRGIGYQLVRLLEYSGDDVIAACRMASDPLIELGVRIEHLDVVDPVSVEAFARRIEQPVDLLINNAGVLFHDDIEQLDFDEIRRQLEVNSMGPLRVTTALMDKFVEGAKVAFVSSHAGSLTDAVEDGRMVGYRMSKAALNMAARCITPELAIRKVSTCILHPGFVRTGMTNHLGQINALQSARALLKNIDALTPDRTGCFLDPDGNELPW